MRCAIGTVRNKKRAFLKLFPQFWKHRIIQIALVRAGIKIDFAVLAQSNHIPQALQLAHCNQAGPILLPFTKHKLVYQTGRERSIIHHSTEQVSSDPESSGSMFCTTLPDMLCLEMQSLHAAVQPWTCMPWNSRLTVFALMLLPDVWSSAVSESAERWYYVPQHSATPLCDFHLPLCS